MYTASHTFKLSWEPPNQNRGVLLYFTANTAVKLCRTNKYENLTIVSPSRTGGHTITVVVLSLQSERALNFVILYLFTLFVIYISLSEEEFSY